MHRRLRAIAVLDPELLQALLDRNELRRRGLLVILSRTPAIAGNQPIDDLVNLLFVLSSFESFDMLADSDRTPDEVVPTVKRAAGAILRGSR